MKTSTCTCTCTCRFCDRTEREIPVYQTLDGLVCDTCYQLTGSVNAETQNAASLFDTEDLAVIEDILHSTVE